MFLEFYLNGIVYFVRYNIDNVFYNLIQWYTVGYGRYKIDRNNICYVL